MSTGYTTHTGYLVVTGDTSVQNVSAQGLTVGPLWAGTTSTGALTATSLSVTGTGATALGGTLGVSGAATLSGLNKIGNWYMYRPADSGTFSMGTNTALLEFALHQNGDLTIVNTKATLQLSVLDSAKVTVISSGNVGIGTTAPTQKLEVNGTIKTDGMIVNGNSYYTTSFSNNDTSRDIIINGVVAGHPTSSPAIVWNNNYYPGIKLIYRSKSWQNSYIAFETTGKVGDATAFIVPTITDTAFCINTYTSYVGIGTTNARAPLEVYSKNATSQSILCEGNLSVWGNLYANQGTLVSSDSRIKKNIKDIDDNSSLDILRKISPKTYQYIDTTRSTEIIYGFISQDIEKVLPYAVSYIKQRIPNIYDFATINNDILTFDNFNTNNLSYDVSNNLYKDLHLIYRNERIDIHIIEVINEKTIRINKDISSNIYSTEEINKISNEYNVPFINETNKIFVYGQEVNDFHILNKDAIWTVSTAALQEVDRQLQAEKQKTSDLQTTLTSVLARLDALEQQASPPPAQPAETPV